MRSESPSLMEPLLPGEGKRELEDLAITLVEKAHRFSSLLRPSVADEMGHLVRSMNCYYSNLIEGHDTHPRDIERALNADYSSDVKRRDLQLEAKAHISLQEKLDCHPMEMGITTTEFIKWLHYEFCENLPDTLLWVENPDTREKLKVVPGEFRQNDVAVGQHIPPQWQSLPQFLTRFTQVYNPEKLSRIDQIIAVAASHHRLLWIHPFLDGNGRVTRLYSHMYLKKIELGSGLWSVARGLARNNQRYKSLLMDADSSRRGDLDGRGNLSLEALIAFCHFFIETCIDQIDFMAALLDTQNFLQRVERYTQQEIDRGRLHKGSFQLLRETFIMGAIERGRASTITNYKERQARIVLNDLVKKGLLKSDTPKAPVRLAFPLTAIEHWFPRLYPDTFRD